MAVPQKVIFTFKDQANKGATSEMFVADGLTLAQLTEGVTALALLIDAVIGALITAINLVINVDISTLTGNTASVTSDVEEIGHFVGVTALGDKVDINIPGIMDNKSVSGSDNLDVTDTDIAALIAAVTGGLVTTGGTITVCDVDSQDITSVLIAREETRNSGRRK